MFQGFWYSDSDMWLWVFNRWISLDMPDSVKREFECECLKERERESVCVCVKSDK